MNCTTFIFEKVENIKYLKKIKKRFHVKYIHVLFVHLVTTCIETRYKTSS